jgi:hypothetical protein
MTGTEIADDQGQRARGDRRTVEIAGADLSFRPVELRDPVPTGRQIAAVSGFEDADAVIVLQQLPNRELQELRPSETTDIRTRGIERFIVIVSDRSFRFVVDGLKLEWPLANPTAMLVKTLIGKGDDYELVQEREDCPDNVIEDDEVIHLEGRGTECFKTRHKTSRHVTVTYNHERRVLEARIYTTEELLAVFGVEDGYVLDRIAHDGEFIELKPGAHIRIKEGMAFVSHAPCGGSS